MPARLRAAGATEEALAEADALVSATHTLLQTGLQEGWELFQQHAQHAAQRPWFKQLDGKRCIAAGFAGYPPWMLHLFAPARLPLGIDWNYDSEALLTRLKLPMLWQLAQAVHAVDNDGSDTQQDDDNQPPIKLNGRRRWPASPTRS